MEHIPGLTDEENEKVDRILAALIDVIILHSNELMDCMWCAYAAKLLHFQTEQALTHLAKVMHEKMKGQDGK